MVVKNNKKKKNGSWEGEASVTCNHFFVLFCLKQVVPFYFCSYTQKQTSSKKYQMLPFLTGEGRRREDREMWRKRGDLQKATPGKQAVSIFYLAKL